MEKITVELQPHTALQNSKLGVVEIEYDQYKVMVNGNLAGYVGKGEDTSVKFIAVSVSQQIKEEICKQVGELLGADGPVELREPARIPDETESKESTDGFHDDDF